MFLSSVPQFPSQGVCERYSQRGTVGTLKSFGHEDRSCAWTRPTHCASVVQLNLALLANFHVF
jgi:hypothetical protein